MFHKVEQPYDFRKRLTQIHRKGLRIESARGDTGDALEVNEYTRIVLPGNPSAVILRAAKDLQEYLSISMGIDVSLERSGNLDPLGNPRDIGDLESQRQNCIFLTTRTCRSVDLRNGNRPRGFRIDCSQGNVWITGYDDEGVLQGVFYLEECMSRSRGPYLKRGTTSQAPLFSPRMVHSGYGEQQYPDAYLGVIAHAGFDSILVIVKDVDTTIAGHLDFNDICQRAAQWGLSVYVYSALASSVHPSDPGAEEYYDKIFGSVFKACPAFKGIVMVGETLDSFPSKDERTTGRPLFMPNPDGFQHRKPAPGWWPCRDYPELIGIVKSSVQKFRPDADIVFWTYNWGYADEKERVELINSLPPDISLMATFEMFEKVQRGGVEESCVDYTLMFEGPGGYFLSEAKAAARRGIRLYSMTNTAGMTWDIGVIPYEPVPNQWMKRYKGIRYAKMYAGIALFSCALVGFFLLNASVTALNRAARDEQEHKLVLMAGYLNRQTELMRKMAYKLQNTYEYKPVVLRQGDHQFIALLKDFAHYNNYILSSDLYFLLYREHELVCLPTSTVQIDYFMRKQLGIRNDGNLKEKLLDLKSITLIVPEENPELLIFALPVFGLREPDTPNDAVLCFYMSRKFLLERMTDVMGRLDGGLTLTFGGTAVNISESEAGEHLSAQSGNVMMTLEYSGIKAYNAFSTFRRFSLFLFSAVVLVIFTVAVIAAYRSYYPIRRLVLRYEDVFPPEMQKWAKIPSSACQIICRILSMQFLCLSLPAQMSILALISIQSPIVAAVPIYEGLRG